MENLDSFRYAGIAFFALAILSTMYVANILMQQHQKLTESAKGKSKNLQMLKPKTSKPHHKVNHMAFAKAA